MLLLGLKPLLPPELAVSVPCKQRLNEAPQGHWDNFPGVLRPVTHFFGSPESSWAAVTIAVPGLPPKPEAVA